MKLITFARSGQDMPEIGIVEEAGVLAVLSADLDPTFQSMLDLIDAGERGLDRARQALHDAERLAGDDVRLRAPLPEPRQMRDALCFERHLRQARANRHLFGQAPTRIDPDEIQVPKVWYDQPIYYKCNRFAISGPDDEILWPRGETRLDYELEFALVIGRGGRDIEAGDALSHVFGYMIFNDFSARDHQIAEMQGGLGPAKGKDFDTANAFGPWLVTADEIPDPQSLDMRAWVNGKQWSQGTTADMHHSMAEVVAHVSRNETLRPGEVIGSGTVGSGCGLELNGKRVQESTTKNMIFSIAYLVSYLSRFMTLVPGDLVCTGTPHGVGLGMKPPMFLKEGDKMHLGIDGLGEQRQNVVRAS